MKLLLAAAVAGAVLAPAFAQASHTPACATFDGGVGAGFNCTHLHGLTTIHCLAFLFVLDEDHVAGQPCVHG